MKGFLVFFILGSTTNLFSRQFIFAPDYQEKTKKNLLDYTLETTELDHGITRRNSEFDIINPKESRTFTGFFRYTRLLDSKNSLSIRTGWSNKDAQYYLIEDDILLGTSTDTYDDYHIVAPMISYDRTLMLDQSEFFKVELFLSPKLGAEKINATGFSGMNRGGLATGLGIVMGEKISSNIIVQSQFRFTYHGARDIIRENKFGDEFSDTISSQSFFEFNPSLWIRLGASAFALSLDPYAKWESDREYSADFASYKNQYKVELGQQFKLQYDGPLFNKKGSNMELGARWSRQEYLQTWPDGQSFQSTNKSFSYFLSAQGYF
jgi:hypothetical protein